MSSKYIAGIDKIPANGETEVESNADSASALIEVTDHAKLRYRQRVDPMAVDAAEAVRNLYRDGYPAPDADQVNEGRARQHGDVLVVYVGDEARPTVKTILRAGDSR